MRLSRMVAFAGLLAWAISHSEITWATDGQSPAAGAALLASGPLNVAAAGTAAAHLPHVKELTAPAPVEPFSGRDKSPSSIDLSKPQFETVPVPEPATLAVAASSLLGVAFFRRRRYSERSVAAVFWLGFSLVAACIAFSILPLGIACFVAGVPSLFYLGALIWFGADIAASALLLAIVLFLNVAFLGQAMANALL
ncbi:MAG: hypothetical protein DCC67_15975 [Planctomycetota bacterium]|nr:MAG: hypothetical protein DCC67_15975 [Planctomycetota bacterium]